MHHYFVFSQVSPEHDLGKIFSLLSCLESAVPLITGPALTLVYNATIAFYPGAIYIVIAGIYAATAGVLALTFVLMRLSRTSDVIGEDARPIVQDEEEGI